MTGSVNARPTAITWGLGLTGHNVKVPFLAVGQAGTQLTNNAPPEVRNRITWAGNWTTQEASFSLLNVARSDGAVYGISIRFDGFTRKSDSVKLKVLGKFCLQFCIQCSSNLLIMITHVRMCNVIPRYGQKQITTQCSKTVPHLEAFGNSKPQNNAVNNIAVA